MAENIRLKDVSNDDESPILTDSSGCQLCLKKSSKYTCPRCNVKYCSLDCYRGRKHVKCSESFYKKCVMDALQGDTIDNEGKRKMVEMLKRFEKEETDEGLGDDESELWDDLEERLEGLNLDQDTEKIWEKLTQQEKKEFERAVDDGYIGTLVDIWVPWWVTRDISSSESVKSNTAGNSTPPKLLKNIPKLSSLIKSKPPNSATKYNLVNILYCYVYICRHYNGCHHDFVQEAVNRLWKLSAVLYHTVNFSSLDASIQSAVEASQQDKKLFNSEEFSQSIIDDISLLLKKSDSRNSFVELALSDIHRLFAKGIKHSKSVGETNSLSPINLTSKDHAKSLWLVKKKILFMLAWFSENKEECSVLVPFLPIIKEAMASEIKQLQDDKLKIEKSRMHRSGKKLIEEIG